MGDWLRPVSWTTKWFVVVFEAVNEKYEKAMLGQVQWWLKIGARKTERHPKSESFYILISKNGSVFGCWEP